MNLLEMRTDVRERLGERTPNFWTDVFINNKINQGQTRFAREERWPWLYAVQPNVPLGQGGNTIELIDGIDWTRHFALALYKSGDSTPILPKRVNTFTGLRLKQKHTGVGEPGYWYPAGTVTNVYGDGDKLEVAHTAKLVPAADQAYTVEYYYIRQPDKLVADTDESIIPEAYQEAIVAWATAQCWLKEINGERKAQSEFNIYNTVLEQAQKDYKSMAQDESHSWGGDPVGRPSPKDELLRRLFTQPLGV